MTTQHAAQAIYNMAIAEADESSLGEGEIRGLLIQLVPSLEHDLSLILDGEIPAPESAQEPVKESAKGEPKSFSDQLRNELRAVADRNRVNVPEG